MAFALRAVHAIAAAPAFRATARVARRAALVQTRAMADEAAEDGPSPVELVDVRVGKVLKAYKHPEADKLYIEEIDVGEEEPRQICSGLVPFMSAEVRTASTHRPGIPPTIARRVAKALNPENNRREDFLPTEPKHKPTDPTPTPLTQDIEGQNVIVLANLKSRNLAGVPSHGMILCASDESHENVELLVCPEGAVPGERVKFGAWESEQSAPHSENQMKKKKTWEKVAPDLKTTADCVAAYKGAEMVTSAGPVKCKSLANALIG